MATQTRFDLNTAIEGWRNELAAQLELSPDDRRELEKHLTDSVVDLQQCGLSDEESFWLAKRRIGAPQLLAEEFIKTNPGEVWRGRIFWMLLGNFFLFVWGFLTTFLTIKLYAGKPDSSLFDTALNLIFMILPLVVGVLLVKGKLTRQAAVIDWFLKSRERFAITAFILSGLASAVMALSTIEMGKKSNMPGASLEFVTVWLPSWLMQTVFIGIIIYFMPRGKVSHPAK